MVNGVAFVAFTPNNVYQPWSWKHGPIIWHNSLHFSLRGTTNVPNPLTGQPQRKRVLPSTLSPSQCSVVFCTKFSTYLKVAIFSVFEKLDDLFDSMLSNTWTREVNPTSSNLKGNFIVWYTLRLLLRSQINYIGLYYLQQMLSITAYLAHTSDVCQFPPYVPFGVIFCSKF